MDSDKCGKMNSEHYNGRGSIEDSLHNLKTSFERFAKVAAKMKFMLEYHQSECTNPNSLALLVIETSAHVNGLVNSLKFTTNHCNSQLESLFPCEELMNFEILINKRESENLTTSTTWLLPPSSNGSEQGLNADIESASSQDQGSSDSGRLSNQERQRSEEPVEDNCPVEIPVPAETVEDEAAETKSCGSLTESVKLALECFGYEIDNDAASSTSSTSGKRKMSKDPDYVPQTRHVKRSMVPPTETSTSPQYSETESDPSSSPSPTSRKEQMSDDPDYAPHGRNRNLAKMPNPETSTSAQYSIRTSKRRIIVEVPSMTATDNPVTSEKRKITPTAEAPAKPCSSANQAPLEKQLTISVCRLSQNELNAYKISSQDNKCEKQLKIVLKRLSQEEVQKWCYRGVPPAPKSCDMQTQIEESEPPVDNLSGVPATPDFEQQAVHDKDRKLKRVKLNIVTEVNETAAEAQATPVAGPSVSSRIPDGPIDSDKEVDTPAMSMSMSLQPKKQRKKAKRKHVEIEKVESSRNMLACHFCESYYAHIPIIYEHWRTCNENPANKCKQVETNGNKEMLNEIVEPVIVASRKIPDGPANEDKEGETSAELGQLDADVEIPTTEPGAAPGNQIENRSHLNNITKIDNSRETSEPIDILNDSDSDVEITEVLPNRRAATTQESTGINNGDVENAQRSIPTASIPPSIHSEPEIPPTNPQSIAHDLYAEAMHPIPPIKLKIKKKRKNMARQTTTSDELKREFLLICAFCDTVPTFTTSKAFQGHHDENHPEMGSPVIKCCRCSNPRNMLCIEEVQTHECTVESYESLP